jgi:DNA-directed RNA polymerase subunit RPC12/RpoP
MAEPVPAGSEVSAGTYRCTYCGTELKVAIGTDSLPPCPECQGTSLETMSRDDGLEDQYPG